MMNAEALSAVISIVGISIAQSPLNLYGIGVGAVGLFLFLAGLAGLMHSDIKGLLTVTPQ